jgi:hypothetical protein
MCPPQATQAGPFMDQSCSSVHLTRFRPKVIPFAFSRCPFLRHAFRQIESAWLVGVEKRGIERQDGPPTWYGHLHATDDKSVRAD